MAIFKGAGVAIVTPMKNNEDVNYDKLDNSSATWLMMRNVSSQVVICFLLS